MKKVIIFVISFFALWTLAWLLHILLKATIWPNLSDSRNSGLFFWALMKVIVWIVFPVFYVKKVLVPKDNKKFWGLANTKKGIIYGLIVSAIWVAGSYFLQGGASLNIVFSLILVWAITGTPISEELVFRGVILPGLQESGMKFWPANVISSVLFILVHCLGWSFQGVLTQSLFSVTAASIFVLSLVGGWLRHKSGSLYGSIILHTVNNLYSAIK
jgi:uncharacterized protein